MDPKHDLRPLVRVTLCIYSDTHSNTNRKCKKKNFANASDADTFFKKEMYVPDKQYYSLERSIRKIGNQKAPIERKCYQMNDVSKNF